MAIPNEIASELTLADTALLFIDMQRRHLDVGGVGYHVLPADRAGLVCERGAMALRLAREADMAVVHVATWNKPAAPWGNRSGRNPFWAWQNGKPIMGSNFVRQADKCTEGSEFAEFMPETMPLPHEPVVVKFRYSGFYMTDLELVLRGLGISNLVIGGVNTNNCVLHTAFDAQARDFRVILLEDACGSMNGEQYHQMGVRQIEASIGWITTVDEFAGLAHQMAVAAASVVTVTTS